jgi:hypothetical protein
MSARGVQALQARPDAGALPVPSPSRAVRMGAAA